MKMGERRGRKGEKEGRIECERVRVREKRGSGLIKQKGG